MGHWAEHTSLWIVYLVNPQHIGIILASIPAENNNNNHDDDNDNDNDKGQYANKPLGQSESEDSNA